jgi:hypothetical protein
MLGAGDQKKGGNRAHQREHGRIRYAIFRQQPTAQLKSSTKEDQ